MANDAITTRGWVADEARALLTRVTRVHPLVLQESTTPAAAPDPRAMRAIELSLRDGRSRVIGGLRRLVHWLATPEARGAGGEELQARLVRVRCALGEADVDVPLHGGRELRERDARMGADRRVHRRAARAGTQDAIQMAGFLIEHPQRRLRPLLGLRELEQVLQRVRYRPTGRVLGETMRSLGRCAFTVPQDAGGGLLVELAGGELLPLRLAAGAGFVDPGVPRAARLRLEKALGSVSLLCSHVPALGSLNCRSRYDASALTVTRSSRAPIFRALSSRFMIRRACDGEQCKVSATSFTSSSRGSPSTPASGSSRARVGRDLDMCAAGRVPSARPPTLCEVPHRDHANQIGERAPFVAGCAFELRSQLGIYAYR
jgi:hypothetical protein